MGAINLISNSDQDLTKRENDSDHYKGIKAYYLLPFLEQTARQISWIMMMTTTFSVIKKSSSQGRILKISWNLNNNHNEYVIVKGKRKK